MKCNYPPGATPLDLDEIAGLIPKHISTQMQLNEWELINILEAENWLSSTYRHRKFLTIDFTKLLHKKMFGKTWKWAGNFRCTNKNIGTNPEQITTELRNLLDDVSYQINNNSYSIDEIAYRFHHRLVSIHPFPNGNGRHARTMTNFLLYQTGQSKFTWGNKSLCIENEIRKQYIEALRKADKHDYTALAAFVRS